MTQNKSKRKDTSTAIPMTASSLQEAHGTIPYGMTNDYMFRAVLQANNKVLRGLVCSLLHLPESAIKSVQITNPIILGEAVQSKEFRLDINIVLNDHTLINLEMQVANKLNWQKRSVIYLCRSFDSLSHGQDYMDAKSAIHIGFLDYTLFDDCPEFYAAYKLMNIRNHHIYSDSIALNVVDLSRIDLATEEDKQYNIHHWAALFKATTWEEIRMLASKDEYLDEASNTIFQMSSDEQIRKQCRDREEYYQDMRNYERVLSKRDLTIATYEKRIEDCDSIISGYEKELVNRDSAISNYEKELENRDSAISNYEKELENRDSAISNYEKELENRDSAISNYEKELENRDSAISNYEKELENRDSAIFSYEKELQNRDSAISNYEKELENRDSAISSYEKELEKLREEIESLKR